MAMVSSPMPSRFICNRLLRRVFWVFHCGVENCFCLGRFEPQPTSIAQDLDAHTAGISALGISFTDGTDHYAIWVPIPSTRYVEKAGIVTQALLDLGPRL